MTREQAMIMSLHKQRMSAMDALAEADAERMMYAEQQNVLCVLVRDLLAAETPEERETLAAANPVIASWREAQAKKP
jgi:hypothetical protein